jgi:hypothetical protein
VRTLRAVCGVYLEKVVAAVVAEAAVGPVAVALEAQPFPIRTRSYSCRAPTPNQPGFDWFGCWMWHREPFCSVWDRKL